MRTIKFRVWDSRTKEMVIDKNQQFDDLIIFRKGELIISDRFFFTQFTGLKDNNGKEIYEGDIVKHHNGYLYIVEFSEMNAWWCLVQPRKKDGNLLEKVYTGGLIGQDIWKGEVIGNIYENPEMLVGEQK
jgi:uncharacterized phage protein (TIGR01671 family)